MCALYLLIAVGNLPLLTDSGRNDIAAQHSAAAACTASQLQALCSGCNARRAASIHAYLDHGNPRCREHAEANSEYLLIIEAARGQNRFKEGRWKA